jgi:hypothetical protein
VGEGPGVRAIVCAGNATEGVPYRCAVAVAIRRGRLGHFLAVGPIDATMAEAAFEGIEAVGELALDPFEIGQAGTVGEFVEHPCRDQIRDVLDLRGFFAERAHGDLPGE